MLPNECVRGGRALANAVKELYDQGQTDYSLEPIVLTDKEDNPVGLIGDQDAVIFCCRRGEREIQLTEAFTEPGFNRFPRRPLHDLDFVILTLYHEKFKDLPVAFAPSKLRETLGEQISRAGLRQLHTSESEKFAHVTFFFNGDNNLPFEGEEDVRVPSPRGIPFDQIPELSLPAVAEQVVLGIAARHDFIVTNFANGDVIGHTSNNQAKIECATLVDRRLEQVVDAALGAGYVVFITADHGNLELMTNPDGSPHVAHTANPVPFIALTPPTTGPARARAGKLADIAPTILEALAIPSSPLMEGYTLLPDHDWGGRQRVLLVILDGWGLGRQDETNPIFIAPTPFWDRVMREAAHASLEAAGQAVGLQEGKSGNSEAGHMNLGAGRVVLQDDVRLERALTDGSFESNEVFCRTIARVQERGARLHLIGLLTTKSSHGSIDYPLALLRMARAHALRDVYLHIIFDGRSTEPGSAPALLGKLESQMDEIGAGQIVSGVGRSIVLDRDGNYARTQRAYEALVAGLGKHAVLA